LPRRKKIINFEENEQDYTEMLSRRIDECETVISEIDNSGLWKIVLRDMEEQKKMLDDSWQDITDPLKIQKARELKFATLHIVNLRDKYEEEMKSKQKELAQLQNYKNEITKDYDNETKLEG